MKIKNNFDENSKLGGHDLYSSSKACCEIVTESFRKSFINSKNVELRQLGLAIVLVRRLDRR